MEFLLERKYLKDTYTIGNLSLNGGFICNILEDKVRDLNKDGDLNDVGEQKIYGETAIPYGRYKITLVDSPAFKRKVPLLHDINGFSAVEIHIGNSNIDTKGCLLPGINNVKGRVTSSTLYFDKIFNLIKNSSEDVYIKII